MKNKKWLLIIVIVIFFINISYIILTRITKVDQLIKSRICATLSQKFNADVNIGFFTFNDKQANVSDFSIKSNENIYDIEIKQIYIEFNLAKLIFSKFKNLRAIEQITILKPSVKINIPTPQKAKKEKSKFTLPEIENFFQKLSLEKGQLELKFSHNVVQLQHKWTDLSVAVVNTKTSNIKLTANSSESLLSASATLDDGAILNAHLALENFSPDKFQITSLDTLYTKIDIKADYSDAESLSYSGNLSSFIIEKFAKIATTNDIEINGNLSKATINSDIILDGNNIELYAEIAKPFNSNRSIDANLLTNEIAISKYLHKFSGNIYASVDITGKINSPDVNIKVNSKAISGYKQDMSDILVSGKVERHKTKFILKKLKWQENKITGFGEYDYKKGLDLQVNSPGFSYHAGTTSAVGDLSAQIFYKNKLFSSLKLANLTVSNPNFRLDKLTLSAILDKEDVKLELTHTGKNIYLLSRGNLKSKEATALLKFNRFDLNEYFNSFDLPLLSGNIEANTHNQKIDISSSMRIYDQHFGKLDGKIDTEVNIDFANKKSNFSLKTNNTKFNYEPISIDLAASGSLDNIKTDKFIINDEIFINSWIKKDEKLDYEININASNIKIKNYLKYVMKSYLANQIHGILNFDITYNSALNDLLKGEASLDRFSYGEMEKLHADLDFDGNLQQVNINNLSVKHKNSKLVDINGIVNIIPELMVQATGKIDSLNFANLLPNSIIKGNIFADLAYEKNSQKNQLDIDLNSNNLKISQIKIDSLQLKATQHASFLDIQKLFINQKNLFEINGVGKLDYNFFTNISTPNSNYFSLNFEGDLFKILGKELNFIQAGKSKSTINILAGMGENGLSIKSGNLSINKAKFNLTNQIKPVDKIIIELNIADNLLDIDKFQFKMGEGKLYIDNQIDDDENNFILGMLNLGKLKVHTSSAGILVHISRFMPSNSVAKINVSGRYEKDLLVSGPFEDMKFFGNIAVSNGDIIFPPDTENLMKLFSKVTIYKEIEEKQPEEKKDLPFTLDLVIDMDELVRYVTYPANLKIDPDSFLHLKYLDNKFKISEALFICKDGSADIFGTQMQTDYLKLQMNEYKKGIDITGNFYKRASDGTVITFEIFENSSSFDNLHSYFQFKLVSDNPDDGIMDILSLLRYGRRVEEIAEGQKKTLLQDEVVHIVGIGLESALLDPLISPVENWIRSISRLDFFYLSTNLVQNVVSNFININDKEFMLNEESQQDYSSLNYDDFLNNLSVKAGKYLSRNMFLDYEARFEKNTDLNLDSKMVIYQFYSLRYNMPYNFRLIYQFQMQPFEENTHQITLQKSFRF